MLYVTAALHEVEQSCESGYPAEVKNHEYRVALTPAGVHELVAPGTTCSSSTAPGVGSSITDADFKAAGAQILPTADEVWASADLLLKVKEPIEPEYHRLRARPGAVHLPAPGRVRGRAPRRCSRRHHRDRLRDRAARPTAPCRCSRR